MKIKVSSKNEYRFLPDIGEENAALPDSEKFAIVLRRLSTVIHAGEWSNYDSFTGQVDVNLIRRAGAHIVRLENAPELEDETGKTWVLEKEDLLNSKHPELYDILLQVNTEITRMDNEATLEVKNS